MRRTNKIKLISLFAGFITCFLMMILIFKEEVNRSLFTSLFALVGMFIADYLMQKLSGKRANEVDSNYKKI